MPRSLLDQSHTTAIADGISRRDLLQDNKSNNQNDLFQRSPINNPMKTLCIVALSIVFLSSLSAQEVLNNDSIVKLVKAGMSEEIVLNMVKTQPAKFELGADEVLALKTGGVSEKIISAMILRGQGVGATSAASPSDSVKIQAKTPVRLIVDETLSSGISKSGQTFRLTVAENVTVDGKVVITNGALATGRITAVRKKSFPNSNGKLEFAVDSVQAIDGQNITLEGHVSEDGGGTSFGHTGKDVKFDKGYLITAVVDSEKEVNSLLKNSQKV